MSCTPYNEETVEDICSAIVNEYTGGICEPAKKHGGPAGALDMKDAVPPSVAEEIRAVFRRHPEVQRATLFGSRAKGNFREGSDIDWALEGDALEGRHLATMLGECEETPIPQKVDLLLKKTLRHQELLDHIERVGVVFYEREVAKS